MEILAIVVMLTLGLAFRFLVSSEVKERTDLTVYKVVVGEDQQYYVWPASSDPPTGWLVEGMTGTEQQCNDYVAAVAKGSEEAPPGEGLLDVERLAAAYSGRDLLVGEESLRFQVHPLGDLALPSGLITVSDPDDPSETPFAQRVPPGKHPVDLAVAVLPGGDERIDYARVRFSREAPVRWRLAVKKGDDPTILTIAELVYGTTDLICLMDPEANRVLLAKKVKKADYRGEVRAALAQVARKNWSWGVIAPDTDRDLNLIVFSSGHGNSISPSFFGFDAENRVVCLVTAFSLSPEADSLDFDVTGS